ncbi:MAG TPA: SGNH/GDSL hydrolase family protein [Candidatus Krumholzibacteria bacterium]|nr:SGNH/GDSL hydrolase family protein [Candidatus Krumholzibacteria bacterium]
MSKKSGGWSRILFFNLVFFGVLLITLELVFGDWFHEPNRVGRLNLMRDCHKHYDATYLYDGAGEITYTRDEWGLRGKYPALNDIDIITLGGSATDQRYVTDGKTWQDVIAREFANEGRHVSVVNAGVDGQSTYGHIKDFDWWFPTLPDFKPRYVLFYVTGNDIYKNLNSEFDDLVNDRKPTWKTHVKERSALYHLASTAMGVYEARHVHKISHRKEPFGSWEWTDQPLVKDHAALVAGRLETYRKAIALLAQKTHALGATPIFVTQSLSAYRFRPDGTVEGRKREEMYDNTLINGVDLYYIVHEFWTVTMEECAKANGVCVDAGDDIRWQPGDFYDIIHNTPQGAERLGKYIHTKLAGLPIGTSEVAN